MQRVVCFINFFLIVVTAMTTFKVKLLKVHEVLGQDIMRLVSRVRGKAN